MRRSIIVLLALLLLLPAAVLKADESLWSAVRLIVQGYRNMTAVVETSLALVNAYKPKPGTAVHTSSGLGGLDFTELAIKLSASGGPYAYLLEVWTKRADVWSKAMEYSYNDGSAGQIVFSPYAFSTSYSLGSLHRIEFQHTGSQRQMTVFSQHLDTAAVGEVILSIGLAREAGDYVDVYVTAYLDNSIGGAGTNDAYLFGARIAKATPHLCTAKQGRLDQGGDYEFTLFGVANPANNGHFNESGFVEDGQNLDGIYPAASSVDKSNLPTSAQMSAANVNFQSTADPDFI
jgi:hypothetical protein